jgi:tetratricopeptide (TPR) repeat protein
VVISGSNKEAQLNCGNSYRSVIKKLNELTRSSRERLHITSFPWRKDLIFFVEREQEKTYKKLLYPEEQAGNFEITRDQIKTELIEAYLAKNGTDITAIATLSTCYGNTGQHQKVLEITNTYLPLAPDNFTLLNNRLIAYTKLRKYKEGVEAGKQVLQNTHSRYNTHYFMAVCYTELQQFEEALFHSRQSLIDNPTRPYNLFQLGYTYYRMNDLDNAIEHYHLAIKAASATHLTRAPIPSAFYNLACLYSVQNKIRESAEAFRKAIELNPKYKPDLYDDEEFENLRNAMSAEELFGEKNL